MCGSKHLIILISLSFAINHSCLPAVSAAQRDNFPKYNIQKFCEEKKDCVATQLEFFEKIKEDAIWFLVTDKVRKKCDFIARSVNHVGDYWLLAACLYINHKRTDEADIPFL